MVVLLAFLALISTSVDAASYTLRTTSACSVTAGSSDYIAAFTMVRGFSPSFSARQNATNMLVRDPPPPEFLSTLTRWVSLFTSLHGHQTRRRP